MVNIALAGSARSWPDRLHRYALDHGGGRIVGRVLSADQIEGMTIDALVIDDICSFLSPGLVLGLKRRGIEVVGVFAPEDGPHAKRRLLDCGISDVLEADASPEEFLHKIDVAVVHGAPVATPESEDPGLFSVAVTGPVAGVGITEVSVGLSVALSKRAATALVDLDQGWPSIAQRLGLPLHPNIRTVLDTVLHHPDRREGLFDLEPLKVVGGRADVGRGSPLSKPDVLAILYWLSGSTEVVIADLGPLRAVPPGLIREFSTAIAVGSPDPVGVARLSATLESLRSRAQSVVGVVNGIPSGFKRSEVLAELSRAHPHTPLVALPYDKAVADAAWDGRPVEKGRFVKALDPMAEVLEGALP